MPENSSDITIVGGGISGLLLAAKLARTLPSASIAVLEKEAHIGGRLGGNVAQLQLVNRYLADFLIETLAEVGVANPEKIAALCPHPQITVVASPSIPFSVERNTLFSSETVQQLGNRTLATVWEKLCAETRTEKLKKTLKNFDQPLATLLDRFSSILNVPSLAALSVAQLHRLVATLQPQARFSADWQRVLPALLKNKNIVIKTECQVVAVQRQHKHWQLQSAQGTQHSHVLVVAQPPWNASEWLAMQHWPAQLASNMRKSKPHSAVCLVSTQIDTQEIPQELCITAEGVHVLRTTQGELALTRVLSYETQLRAPAVTTAVGKLKRALRSLNRIYETAAEPRLIALVPAAYCLPLGEAQAAATGLFFCGDSCGKSENGDDNTIASVQDISEGVVNFLQN